MKKEWKPESKNLCTTCKKEVERPWKGKNYRCDVHLLEYNREWRKSNQEKVHASNRKHREKHKLLAYKYYSGGTPQCKCCGEQEICFLTIDHIDGGGRKHSKSIRDKLAAWVVRNGFPGGFQILCFNCNCGKSINKGICPHKRNIVKKK